MKRIHLFEIEDQSWFPDWIRDYLTKNLNVFHKILNTKEDLANLLNKVIEKTGKSEIVDLCSGAGGPIIETATLLKEKHGRTNLKLTLSDLYPNKKVAKMLNSDEDKSVSYYENSLNAEHVEGKLTGIRSMVCSLHHMKPEVATNILADAQNSEEGFCAIEISDNSYPKWIWWLTIPFSFIICLFITPMAKKLTLGQIIFTYLIPIVPLFFAWDGAVSNARTYTMDDIEIILSKIRKPQYTWEPGVLTEGKSKKMYLIGYPTV